MKNDDIRWIQRFNHFTKALSQLSKAVKLSQERTLSNLEELGLIQSFEYTFELTWNTVKDYFETQGETAILGCRDAIRLAFRRGLILDGDTWMAMLEDRKLTTHSYNEETARTITASIITKYFPEFLKIQASFQNLPGLK